MHRWAKYLLLVVALIVLAGFAASFFRPGWRPQRRRMLFVFLAMVLGSGMVGLLKQTTNRHCPYDLDIYGGYAPYKKLLEPAASGIRPGECWPGGHASGGFGLMAFYFLWRRSRPRLAWAGLVTGLAYGSALGAGRMIQGAHFLSHNLWSALICWFVALLLYELLLRRDEQPVAHP
jgi:membrane-associated PAP2 superfamily phosphatase